MWSQFSTETTQLAPPAPAFCWFSTLCVCFCIAGGLRSTIWSGWTASERAGKTCKLAPAKKTAWQQLRCSLVNRHSLARCFTKERITAYMRVLCCVRKLGNTGCQTSINIYLYKPWCYFLFLNYSLWYWYAPILHLYCFTDPNLVYNVK